MQCTLRAFASGFAATVLCCAAEAAAQPERSDDVRVRDAAVAGDAGGGIAGVAYYENFESGYVYGPVTVPIGDVEIINHPDPMFGAYSLLDRAAGHGNGIQEYRSPIFALSTGDIHADIIINDTTSLFHFITVNATTSFFNTRVSFESNGTIRALQIVGAPPCTAGVFAVTTGTWTPGVKMRIGVEVTQGNILRVYKDNVQIFQGHDVSQFCAAGNPAIGVSQLRNFNSNIGTTATFVIDNISSEPVLNECTMPLPYCRADVTPEGGDGVVNIDDLLTVINFWGANGQPAGPRPPGDCSPGVNGDCLVNIDDLLETIHLWGACPVPIGACCIQGSCSIQTLANCTGAPNFGTYHGNFVDCAQVQCLTPPPGDLCSNPLTASGGFNNWSNTNANTDGPVAECAGISGVRGDVWFKYTATCGSLITFDTVGTQAPFTDTVLEIFASSSCDPIGQMIACNDDIDSGGGNKLSRVSVHLCSGREVLIRCASNGGTALSNSGAATLNIFCSLFNNDFCSDAFNLIIDQPMTCSGSIQGSTVESQPNCLPGDPQPPLGRGRWYRVTGNGKVLTASTCGSPLQFTWDGRLSVYCGLNCNDLTCVVASASYNCGPGGVPGTGTQESVTWCSRVGQPYWILVSADVVPLPPDGGFQLLVTSGAPCGDALPCGLHPGNDFCANALPIANGATTFSTVFATTDGTINSPLPPGVDCNDSGATPTANDIWYRYTPICNGLLTVSTCPQLGGTSNYDTDLVLYPGNATCPPASSQIIACNDDDPDHPCGQAPPWQSTLTASVTAGQSYLLRVGGWNDFQDRGTGVLSVICEYVSCGNGIIETGEQCDDGNAVPGDGCTNCVVDAACSERCSIIENEPCVEGPDTVNGGCNTTPALFSVIAIKGDEAVVCGESWATEIGTLSTRDLDWYAVTVGDSGVVEAHITAMSLLPMWVVLGTATGPPDSGPCQISVSAISTVALQGECSVASRNGLTPGDTVLVVAVPNVFTGFPCGGVPWNYSLRIVSP